MLCGRTHCELVHVGLADENRPGRGKPADYRGVVRRQPAGKDSRRARRGHAPSAEQVLQGDGHTGKRAGVLAAGNQAVYLGCAGTGLLLHDEVEGVDVALEFCDPAQVLLQHGGRREPSLADIGGHLCRRARPGRSRSRRLPKDPRDPEAVIFDVGSLGEDLVPVQARPGDILPENVGQRERMRRRGHPLDVERRYIGGVLEDRGELGRVALQFLLGQARRARRAT